MKKNKFIGECDKHILLKTLRIMRITVFLLLATILQTLANNSYSQKTKISLDVANQKLIDVLDEIENRSEFFFLYNEKLIETNRTVSISVNNRRISEILDELFAGTDVVYTITDRKIILAPSFLSDSQQQKSVSGRVTDESGEPLPGVTVIVKGTTHGTTTNKDGQYSLDNVPSDATLIFSFVGMKKQEIPINGRTNINVSMVSQMIGIDEVVAIGYGTMKKSDLTGSIASVSSEDLELTPLKTVASMIQGAVSGVEVVQGDAAPGGNSIVRIRGGNSMLGDNDPLYVVDGMPGTFVGSSNDIESIEVLKDASATAIYGSRGANGVIIITTKRGSGEPSLRVEGYYGLQTVRKKYDLLNAREYAEFANEKAENLGRDPYYPDLNNLPGNTDWQDEIFQVAPIQNYNITSTGGSQKSKYAIMGNFIKQEGIIKSSYNTTASVKMNLDNTVNDWFKISTSLVASHESRERVRQGSVGGSIIYRALTAPPLAPVFDEDGEYFLLGTLPTSDPLWSNPVQSFDVLTMGDVGNRINGNTNLIFTLLDGLDFSVRAGANYYNHRADTYAKRTPTGVNSASISESDSYTYLIENILTYKKVLNNKHDINLTAGYTWEESTYSSIGVSGSDFLNDIVKTNDIGSAGVINTPSSYKSQSSIISWIGRANYILDKKYLFTVTARADGSTRLGENNKWGLFPSAAIGWRVSEEDFMQDVDAISNLKLRVSYGITGNQGIGTYVSLSRLSVLEVLQGVNEERYITYVPSVMQNPDLKWEETAQFDIGFDLGLFDQKIDLTFDYYNKQTKDLLAIVPLPRSSGYTSITKNFGSMENKGFELGLNSRIINNSDWLLTVGANFSLNRNKVLEVATESGEFYAGEISSPINTYVNLIREGEPLSVLVGYKTDGLWEEDQSEGSIQPTAKAGDQRYVDTNPDGIINDDDKVILGSPYPDFIYGLNTNLSYRNFSLNVLLQGAQGGSRFLVHKFAIADNFSRFGNQLAETKDHWSVDNPDPNAAYPRLSNIGPFVSDRYVEDASYLRFKTISLAYNFPSQNTGFLKEFMVYISGENLITLTKYNGYDPEVDSRSSSSLLKGLDDGAYPHAKTYTVGLKINF